MIWLRNLMSVLVMIMVYFQACQCDETYHHLNNFHSQRSENKTNGLYTKSSARKGRSPDIPVPQDCQLSQWSQWTECFPCEQKKSRYRRLLRPAKFGGSICAGYLWDEAACTTTKRCVPKSNCGQDFQCAETGRCIKRHLVCNGDKDCRDGSDEENCEEPEIESFCKELFPIPGSERAAQGFNILTREGRLNILDPTYYGGHCEYSYNGEWRELKYESVCERLYYNDDEKYFRKPYNFHLYKFLARADSGFSSEYYEDAAELLRASQDERSKSFGFTIGVSVADSPLGIEFGMNFNSHSMFLKNISQYSGKDVGFIRVHTTVQTAQFKMRSNNLVLDEDAYQTLMELPDEYNYGMYAKFLNDFGTHYVSSGTMGGIYEYVLVVDKEMMRHQEITAHEIGSCIGASLGIPLNNLQYGGLSGSGTATLSFKSCNKGGGSGFGETESSRSIKDVLPQVQGGDTGSGGRLLSIADAQTYRYWGRSLKYNPALIEFELLPIHELLSKTGLAELAPKRQHLKRALEEYINEFSACRCGPCLNNGEPILSGDSCLCQCPQGYDGSACEKSSRRGPMHGAWSCWTSWSQCQSGQSRRTRECNNPAPKDGGRSCLGKSIQIKSC